MKSLYFDTIYSYITIKLIKSYDFVTSSFTKAAVQKEDYYTYVSNYELCIYYIAFCDGDNNKCMCLHTSLHARPFFIVITY